MKAHELLSSPDKWIKGTLARNKDGQWAGIKDDNASCWCALGAIYKCYGFATKIATAQIIKLTSKLNCNIAPWNDAPGRTYEEVVGLLRELDI